MNTFICERSKPWLVREYIDYSVIRRVWEFQDYDGVIRRFVTVHPLKFIP